MDGETNAKPSIKRDDSGGKPAIFGYIHIVRYFLEPDIPCFFSASRRVSFWRLDGYLKWEICLGQLVPSFGRVEMKMSFDGFNMRIIRYFEIYVRDQIVFKYQSAMLQYMYT